MDRRSFLRGIGLLAGAAALEQIPGNRVWSFPKKIVCVNRWDEMVPITHEYMIVPLRMDGIFKNSPVFERLRIAGHESPWKQIPELPFVLMNYRVLPWQPQFASQLPGLADAINGEETPFVALVPEA